MKPSMPMKTFYWKEWRENWQSAFWPPVLMTTIVCGIALYNSSASALHPNDLIDFDGIEDLLIFFWSLSAVLCGASLVAPEKSSGTLQFLRSLPLLRGSIWRTKLLVGVATLALSVTLTTAAFALVYYTGYAAHAFATPLGSPFRQLLLENSTYTLALIPLFALGYSMSVYFDRVISAVISTVITAALLVAATIASEHNLPYNVDHSHFVWLMYGIICGLALLVSYLKFTCGERIRASRLLRRALIFSADLLLIFVALVVSILWLIW